MELQEASEKFIQSWAQLGTNWGINKTMAQIHALLLISKSSMSTEEMMDKLQISRGNTNMNVRALIDWGLVYREHKLGERMEFFRAEKDISKVARCIARERRKREIETVISLMAELSNAKLGSSDDAKEFTKVSKDIHEFSSTIDGFLDKFSRSDENWFYALMLKLMK